ncbi:MAG: TonB-dependent receptor plug domain-containing protein [bacterium]
METLRLFYKDEEIVYAPTRSAKSITQIGENVTVITAQEIEKLKAHTLSDILYRIPGLQLYRSGGPGSPADLTIQGSQTHHVLLMIDGMKVNSLVENFAFSGLFPIQNIERIEIIKGPASSSWGSALGGIVNVITKSFPSTGTQETSLRISHGGKTGLDGRVTDLTMVSSEKGESFSYYFLGKNLQSGDLSQNTQSSLDNVFGKMRWDSQDTRNMALHIGYNEGKRGVGAIPGIYTRTSDWKQTFMNLMGNLFFTEKAGLYFSYKASRLWFNLDTYLASGSQMSVEETDSTHSGSLHLTYEAHIHKIIVGSDFDSSELEVNFLTIKKEKIEKKAVFFNDTLSGKNFSLTPGIRYDWTSLDGDFWSPSLGLTINLGQKSLLRIFGARGFHQQSLTCIYGYDSPLFQIIPNPKIEREKVRSIQIGIESTSLTYFWLKATFFRHFIWDARKMVNPDPNYPQVSQYINEDEQRRQGFEMEMQTISFSNLSMRLGYAYIEGKDLLTDSKINDMPTNTFDIGVEYDDPELMTILLQGHYMWWRYRGADRGEYDDVIWDLILSKEIRRYDKGYIEAFLTGHNIFNGAQYKIERYNKVKRWVEAGMKVSF